MSYTSAPALIELVDHVDTYSNPIAAYQYVVDEEEKALQLMDKARLANIRLSLTKILIENCAYKEALTKIVSALAYYDLSGELDKQAICWRHMASIYGFLGNRTKQQAYNKKCLRIIQQLDAPLEEIKILNNIGHTYMELGNYDSAIAIFEENLNKEEASPDLYTVSLKNLAMAYTELQAYEKAKFFCKKTRLAAKKYNLLKYLTACDYLIGRIHFEQGLNEAALMPLKRAIETLTQKDTFKKELLVMSECHLKALTKVGPLAEINYYTQKYISLSKEVHQNTKDETLKNLQFQFEINEIEKERLLLEEENEALQKANYKIDNQRLALIIKSTQLEAVNSELNAFSHRIAHDLKQPIRTLQGFISLLTREINATMTTKSEKYLRFINSSTVNMTKFVDDLLLYAKSDQNSQPTETVDCTKIILQIENQLATQLQETKAKLVFEKLPTIQAHPTLILQVFQNLISNALKFHQPNVPPIIKINSTEHQYNYIISVSDNGIGIEERHQKKVFQLFTQLNDKEKYEGSGIGLSTVVKVLRRYNASIKLQSVYGVGTTFNIIFPK